MTSSKHQPVSNVLILIDSHERFNFFKRFFPSLLELGLEVTILSSLPSLRFSVNAGVKFKLAKNPANKLVAFSPSQCLEYASGEISETRCRKIYSAFYLTALSILKNSNTDLVLVWNGSRTQSKAVIQAAKENNIPTLFFELGNIPGKLFVDPNGVNSHSFLYHNDHILDGIDNKHLAEFEVWRERYIENKNKLHSVRQAKSARRLNMRYGIDLILWYFGFSERLVDTGRTLRKKSHQSTARAPIKFDQVDLNSDFLFLPLQVNRDSQLFFHSDIANLEAIQIAMDLAKQSALQLVIKIHPAEEDDNLIHEVTSLRQSDELLISDQNTFHLIHHAAKIVTINSSVALEALIAGRTITRFLGKSIFEKMNTPERIAQYITRYLMDIDYFSDADLSKQDIANILERANLKPL